MSDTLTNNFVVTRNGARIYTGDIISCENWYAEVLSIKSDGRAVIRYYYHGRPMIVNPSRIDLNKAVQYTDIFPQDRDALVFPGKHFSRPLQVRSGTFQAQEDLTPEDKEIISKYIKEIIK